MRTFGPYPSAQEINYDNVVQQMTGLEKTRHKHTQSNSNRASHTILLIG